jgi:uncharacterized protein
MPKETLDDTILITMINVRPNVSSQFAAWRERMNGTVASFDGFVSLEMRPPEINGQNTWKSVQRFLTAKELNIWRNSPERQQLIEELKPLLLNDKGLQDVGSSISTGQENVTEVFVTKVSYDKHNEYRAWASKIQQVEAQFPAYQGVYIQSPPQGQDGNWITILRFDTPEHLDNWIGSKERKAILEDAQSMVEDLQSHRVVSPFAGWFAGFTKETGEPPAVWKQTMLVLLVLFPIVMIELRFLNPLLAGLNHSLATFIANTISVALVSWPMMPFVIRFLGWWLTNESENKRITRIVGGTLIVCTLYIIEISCFWNFL